MERKREIKREIYIYFKEFVYITVEAHESKVHRVGWQSGDPDKVNVVVQIQRQSAGRSPFSLRETSLSVNIGMHISY